MVCATRIQLDKNTNCRSVDHSVKCKKVINARNVSHVSVTTIDRIHRRLADGRLKFTKVCYHKDLLKFVFYGYHSQCFERKL